VNRTGRIYFASDLHLGAPDPASSTEREKRFVRWLDSIRADAEALYLLGDVFDMWFEYGKVIPKGHVRLLGKLAEMADEGLPIHYFTGNHDMWVFDHLPDEIGMKLHRDPLRTEIKGKRFLLGHGDGLGPGDKGYKFIKKVFRNPVSQWLYRWIHPDVGLPIANYFSKTSREAGNEGYLGEEREWLVQYCKGVLREEAFDYFIFGHRHLPLDIPLGESEGAPRYINLGDWIQHDTYAVFDGEGMELKRYEEEG
jgi:UDP-2,3-diacylglucosamine hydrolase